MTRLRYDDLVAVLGANITNSATSITFAAALTSDAGTAVPTLTGSDYFALSILDVDGRLVEIVHVTAYTTGGTSATVARGQEGTTGTAATAGAVLVNAPTAIDFTGGGGGTGITWSDLAIFRPEDFGAAGDGTTDDTTAVRDAIDAAYTAGGGTVLFGPHTYLCNGAIDTSRGGAAIIALPQTGSGTGPAIRLLGTTPALNYNPITPQAGMSVLKTTKTGVSNTTYVPSLLGGRNDGTFTYLDMCVENMVFQVPHDPTLGAVDFVNVGRMEWTNSVCIAWTSGDSTWTQPTHNQGFGLRTPRESNYNKVIVNSGGAYGFFCGLAGHAEHLTVGYWSSKWCAIGFGIQNTTTGHGASILKMSLEWCNYHISGYTATSGGGLVSLGYDTPVTIQLLDLEDTGSGFTTVDHIYDPSNHLRGVIRYLRYDSGGAFGGSIVVNGATGISLHNLFNGEADPGALVHSVVAGSGVSVDNTDPKNPVLSATGGGGGGGGGTGHLAEVAYNPGTLAAYSKTGTTDADVDATNLAVSFTAPASGIVDVRLEAVGSSGGTVNDNMTWSLRNGSTVVASALIDSGVGGVAGSTGANKGLSKTLRVTGLTPADSYTLKWGWHTNSGAITGVMYAGGIVNAAYMIVDEV